ncbi:MAG: glycosyltransferase family 39 protein, partial [Bryobacteraceae bacterium]|nr:glycosyltransferase family 39 protein [Bryobacteraceae bacterium]
IPMASVYGAPSGWAQLWQDSAFRFRFTYIELTWLLHRLFGFTPAPFYAASIALHIACTWIVYATGVWSRIGWNVALPAAAFFAVYEGHQEAVMWVAASMELLMFLFGVSSFLFWARWLETRRAGHYVLSLIAFCLALLSKESAVVFPLLLTLTGLRLLALLPFLLLSAAAAITAVGGSNARLGDGSFSFHAPFWVVLPNSYWRLLFVWGIAALLVIVWRRAAQHRALVLTALVWMLIALLPYSFLLYMNRMPSRQTYLASLGVSWIVGAAWTLLPDRRLVAAVTTAILVSNVAILWGKKRDQFLQRAEPTERLLRILRETKEPVTVHCFPYELIVAERAAESVGRKIHVARWPNPPPDCLAVTAGDRLIRIPLR